MKAAFALHRSRLALALTAALPALATAAPGQNSPYLTDAQNTHVEDATSKGVNQVNMITCFMSSIRPDALVNKGNYIALVDKNKCDAESRSSSDNSGSTNSGSNAPSYMTATVNSSRSSNSDPMRVKTWIDQPGDDGFSGTIYVNIQASEAPSASNPYGVFRLDYCGKGDGTPCMMRGFLEGSTSGISYFEIEGGGGQSNTRALRLTTSGTDSGAGMLRMDEHGQSMAYSFAYNANYFRRSNGNSDDCFSRDATDAGTEMSVWRYGLYDAETGERINRRSGFPIEYTSNGKTYNGYMGYWGLSLPPEAAAANGATVQRVEFVPNQPPTRTDYTLVKADGRLTKYTKRTKLLSEIDKIKFQTFVNDTTGFFSGAESNQQYEMYWDDAAGVFKATAVVDCRNGPCQTRDLDSEKAVLPSFFSRMGGMRGWSQALGGELFVPLSGVGTVQSSSVNVIYRVQDLVYPADMPATLYCVRECPTAQTINAYFAQGSVAASPFVSETFNHWGPTTTAVSYTTNAAGALLQDAAGAAVSFTDRQALQQRPQYQSGLRTGRLFTSLEAAKCASDPSRYCEENIEAQDTYYQWETGPNQWNQFASLKDASGNVVNFDAPLQLNYTVPAGAQYGQYAGKSIVLQYGGFGDLWGVPGHCVSRMTNEHVSCETQEARYVPAFVIPFDDVAGRVYNGSTPLLAKWLEREIRFARKDVSVCTAAGVALPSGLTLPDASGLSDTTDPASGTYIGSKPAVTDAPRVVQGDVKY
ncbi:MAG TPA: hypothetical protein VFP68_19800 [Burkholderiaceae bacterium]|nr:hypothetical protein [Burkholderiaceae bacterium]